MKRATFKHKDYFETIDTPLKAYFLGYIAADGCAQDAGLANLTLQMTLHEKDVAVLELLKLELGSTHKIQTYNKRHESGNVTTHRRLSISNKKLTEDLVNLGVVQNKTLILGNIMNNISNEFHDAFCIGYFDGDGTVSKQYSKKFIKSINDYRSYEGNTLKASIKGTQELLQGIKDHLGINNRITKQKGKNVHILRVTSQQGIKDFYSMYSGLPFYLERKKLIFDKYMDNHIYQQEII